MKRIWDILQIEPTCDEMAIKRAYAAQARINNPEEHPQEFLQVREAYEAALAYAAEESEKEAALEQKLAGAGVESDSGRQPLFCDVGDKADNGRQLSPGDAGAGPDSGRRSIPGDAEAELDNNGQTFHDDADTEWKNCHGSSSFQGFCWDFAEENPFREKEGIKRFQELYTGKRRRERAAWADYFLSEVFLEGYREKGFADLMLEVVRENQSVNPPSQEFLTELYIAYGLKGYNMGDGIQLQVEQNAVFEGIDIIKEIAMMGRGITRFKGNDSAMMAGFQDYRELLVLALGNWDDGDILRLGKIVDGYLPHHISDRPIQNSGQYELSQRHPKSLRLLTYFFSRQNLPVKVCKVPWNHLHLESATLGRDKLWYGGLREALLARLPELMEKPRISYMQLLQELGNMCFYGNDGQDAQEREVLDGIFQREDMLCALQEEAFVEEHVLRYWVGTGSGKYLLRKLQEYYCSHREAPFAGKILKQIDQTMEYKEMQEKFQEDMRAPLSKGVFDLRERPCLRYYLNVAFHQAYGIQNSNSLYRYLDWYMPYSPKWGKRLADPREGGFDAEHPIGLRFGDNVLFIRFHPLHMEYLWGDSPLVPPFPGEELARIEDDMMFWLLAPIARADFGAHQGICEELTRRLSALPLSPEAIPAIADCITGHICHFEEDDLPICTFYQEKESEGQIRLYGCDIFGDGVLTIYEETGDQKQILPNGTYNAPTLESAVQMGQRLLRELSADKSLKLYMELLPKQMLVRGMWNLCFDLSGEQVTEEKAEEMFDKYFQDEINRLELVWEKRSLLFIKNGRQYACFYFDHQDQDWYALVSMPEVYAVVESDQVVYVPFGLGMLPNYLVHQNTNYIRSLLRDILEQIACSSPRPQSMMWSPQIYRFETRQRYRLAMRQFGGYLPEQARNQLADRFYIPQLPFHLSYVSMEGEAVENSALGKNKAALQGALANYMAGRLASLTLIWQYETVDDEGKAAHGSRRLLLLQDQGTHMMVYDDGTVAGMQWLVADVKGYIDGKKYKKVAFLGAKAPNYLVHKDLIRIRDSLDLLLPQMGQRQVNLGGFGEFSFEGNDLFDWYAKT